MKAAKLGEEILINASTTKAGKTLAFLKVDVTNKSTGAVIATGNHIKHIG